MSLFALLIACNFKLQSGADIPPKLHRIYLTTPYSYSQFTNQLKDFFRAMKMQIVSSPKDAPIGLIITSSDFVNNNPGFTSTNMAVTYVIQFNVSATLADRTGNPIGTPLSLSLSRNLILNSDQITTPDIGTVQKQSLRREAIILLYHWLISKDTVRAIQNNKT